MNRTYNIGDTPSEILEGKGKQMLIQREETAGTPDKLLIAIGKHGGTLIIEALGQDAVNEITSYSFYLEDHAFNAHVPDKPGFYVWEGKIVYYEDDIDWQGEFREAAPEDLAVMNIEATSEV